MRSRIAATAMLFALLTVPIGLSRVAGAQASGIREGIDVSSFQGMSIAWHSVAASGISFAYIRAGDGSSNPDGAFGVNWRGATSAGVTPGAYLFFEPAQSPVAQADLLISQLRSVGFTNGDLIPAIDVETTDGQPRSVVVANLRTMVDTVSAAIGSLPAIYAAPAWWNGNVDSSAFTLDPLWVANWGVSSPSVPANNWGGTGWQVWQFSDAGSVPGVPGRVDLDQSGPGPLPYYGWPDPVALAATNVASAPETVSDQPGDINVLWRGLGEPPLDARIPQRGVVERAHQHQWGSERERGTRIQSVAHLLGSGDDRGVLGGRRPQPVAVNLHRRVVRQRHVVGSGVARARAARLGAERGLCRTWLDRPLLEGH